MSSTEGNVKERIIFIPASSVLVMVRFKQKAIIVSIGGSYFPRESFLMANLILDTRTTSLMEKSSKVVVKKRISNSLDEIIEEIKYWTGFLEQF